MPSQLCFAFVLLGVTLAHGYENFRDYMVIRTTPTSEKHVKYLISLQATENFDFWKDPGRINSDVDIMVNKSLVEQLLDKIQQQGMEAYILHSDVDSLVENTLTSAANRESEEDKHNMTWDRYHRLSDVYGYMQYLAETYPELCQLKDLGSSFEGRPMYMLVIENKQVRKPKRNIMIDGGMHGREWISVAVVSHLLKDFVEDYEDYYYILDHFVLHIIPTINPDGYEYTHTHKRLWKKTRSGAEEDECRGADPNRNFDIHWGESGVSYNPCSDVYPGLNAFSEREVEYIADYLTGDVTFDLYLSFQSYSQTIVYPWGYEEVPNKDAKDLMNMAEVGATAIEMATGQKYILGSSSHVQGLAAGRSDDYAKAKGGVKYSYTIELRDQGYYGFLLPPRFIEPTTREATAMTAAMMDALAHDVTITV